MVLKFIMAKKNNKNNLNIGFISTRISGRDGVSLEIKKWADIFQKNGYQCFYFAGEIDRPANKSMLVKKAHFKHREIEKMNKLIFGKYSRGKEVSDVSHFLRKYFKNKIYDFIKKFKIDLIITENVFSIPLNIPLALALTEFIAETEFPVIAHHHDFYWERKRFLVNGVNDYLEWAFPPNLKSIKHVVINSLAREQLSYRKGISSMVVPNVYNFAISPSFSENRCAEIRRIAKLGKDDLFILQPTRVIPRKKIEKSIEIVSQIKERNKILVISHNVDDEGDGYYRRIKEYADGLGVGLSLIKNIIGPEIGEKTKTKRGKFSLGEVYNCSDFVIYPSEYEGFGNAFLEAVYYKKPILMNRYPVYVADIEPKGFEIIAIDELEDKDIIKRIKNIVFDKERKKKMTENNYDIALRYFSYELLERNLNYLLNLLRENINKCQKR